MATNIWTEVEINEKKYMICKFTAKDGLKIARLVIAKLTPIMSILAPDETTADKGKRSRKKAAADNEAELYKAVSYILDNLSDDDIEQLINKCLRVCYADLPAGKQAVMDETGHYGIEDIEYDMVTVLKLCIEAIKWGASDFFGEKGLTLKALIGQAG